MSLVQPLFDGPIDIVGDLHGEIDALRSLLRRSEYDDNGHQPEGRRLVFIGDLTDRGPDSPAVVDLVQILVESGKAQCIFGNHDLNILLNEKKEDNHWFFGKEWGLDKSPTPTPAVLATDAIRSKVRSFFQTLPLGLERDDLRVVHACWDDQFVDVARRASDVLTLYREYEARIASELASQPAFDDCERNLRKQNGNPVKVLTSGKERRTDSPFKAGGKVRCEERVPWWEDYTSGPLCVFGHYAFFSGHEPKSKNAACVDFAVGKRWMERPLAPGGRFQAKLAAFRFPEKELVFDDDPCPSRGQLK